MARLIRSLRRTQIPGLWQNPISFLNNMGSNSFCLCQTQQTSAITRSYVSEMRKAAFQDNILRLLRREIQYELDRLPSEVFLPFFFAFDLSGFGDLDF
uniref:Uncharacterized protein MANES_11G064600 n=1 Tax=Rhizophora mucronata TaxID=61149 RepID=A0A2P2JES1_RHIMU